jgi:tRNA (cmo5U34)-methyltransferase
MSLQGMVTDSTVRDTFDRLASEYDELKLRIIPGYRKIQEMALRYSTGATRVLELGCGTGEWAAMFLEKNPDAEYHAIEFSAKMRELAAARLSAHGNRFRLIDQDLNAPLPAGPFDVVVSFFAIHHVDDKGRLFREVFDRLSPGRGLVFADITVAADPDLESLFLDGWIDFMRQAGLEEERIPHVLDDHRRNDLPEPVAQLLSSLRAAGFETVEVVWSWEKFALLYARKRPLLEMG